GQNLERAIEREAAGHPFPEMVQYGEGVWHCIHPEFLKDQLDRSLERLGLQALDVCLLHNPEYYLSDAHERSHGTLEKRREEFYRRLAESFAFLEAEAAAGRILSYGVSSTTCTRPAAALEAEYRREIAARLQAPEGATSPAEFFRWSADLKGASAHVRGLDHWTQIEAQRIVPRLTEAVQALDEGITGPLAERWRDWRNRYLPELRTLLSALRSRAAAQSRAVTDAVSAALDPLFPPARRSETLSRKALWVVASTPGVSCVLIGMRAPAYVDDALGILSWPPLPD